MEPTKKHTPDSVAEIVARNLESDLAERVLDALKRVDGQLITTRVLDKLPGGRVEWRLKREMGWTQITNRAYIRTRGDSPDAVTLVLARSEDSVPIDAVWVEQENARYFADRRARNALRTQALKDHALLERVAIVMNQIEDISAHRRVVATQFAAFLTDGEPLSPDTYDLQRAVGLRDDKQS